MVALDMEGNVAAVWWGNPHSCYYGLWESPGAFCQARAFLPTDTGVAVAAPMGGVVRVTTFEAVP